MKNSLKFYGEVVGSILLDVIFIRLYMHFTDWSFQSLLLVFIFVEVKKIAIRNRREK
jgi:hypothetical protein